MVQLVIAHGEVITITTPRCLSMYPELVLHEVEETLASLRRI